MLDHEERNVYRVSVKATDAGRPPRHSIRALRVEVLALADNRPTFTSSSLTFNVSISATISPWIKLLFSSPTRADYEGKTSFSRGKERISELEGIELRKRGVGS